MILPNTFGLAMLLAIVSMICWGSWANTLKMMRKWRFELFYFDFAIGLSLTAVITAFTFGSMGDELSVMDNFLITGKRQIAWAFVAGAIFNLGNILIVAAMSITGLAFALPVGLGLGLVIGGIGNYLVRPSGNPLLVFGGLTLVLIAVVANVLACRLSKRFSIKALVLGLIGGLFLGLFYPVIQLSRATEVGLGPYTVVLLFAAGAAVTTVVYNLYFMNLPVEGEPVGFGAYFSGPLRNHILGVIGGIVWCVGLLSLLLASSPASEPLVDTTLSFGIAHGAALMSSLWGILVWKEFAGAHPNSRMLLTATNVLFLVGIGMVCLSPSSAQ